VAEQLDAPKVITILNISFVFRQWDDCASPPLSGHLGGPVNNIKLLCEPL